jgi:hypothetical protein
VLQETGPDISNSTVSVPPARRYSNATSHSYLPTAIKPTGSLELGAYMLDATTDNSTPRDKGEHLNSSVCTCHSHVNVINIIVIGSVVYDSVHKVGA